jgi:hypothetical protein
VGHLAASNGKLRNTPQKTKGDPQEKEREKEKKKSVA